MSIGHVSVMPFDAPIFPLMQDKYGTTNTQANIYESLYSRYVWYSYNIPLQHPSLPLKCDQSLIQSTSYNPPPQSFFNDSACSSFSPSFSSTTPFPSSS